jgi:hypothetical protein
MQQLKKGRRNRDATRRNHIPAPSQSRGEIEALVSTVRLAQRSILVCVQCVALTVAISAVAKAFEVLEEQKDYVAEIKRYANDVY